MSHRRQSEPSRTGYPGDQSGIGASEGRYLPMPAAQPGARHGPASWADGTAGACIRCFSARSQPVCDRADAHVRYRRDPQGLDGHHHRVHHLHVGLGRPGQRWHRAEGCCLSAGARTLPSPLPQCPLRAAPAHQSALRHRRRRRSLGWGDGAVRLGLDRDLPRSQRTRRRRAARAGRILGAIRGMEPEGFATTLCLGILDARFAVCGGEEIAVDRWYHRLLVLLLVFLLSSHAHSLFKSRPARFCPFPSAQRALSSPTIIWATRLPRDVRQPHWHEVATVR